MFPSPLLIGSEIYRFSRYGSRHPLAIPRVSTTLDLIRALGWLDEARYLDSPMASACELARFHTPDYIAALRATERDHRASPQTQARHTLGRAGNPIFPEMFRRPATACGASLAAADLLAAHEGTIYSPGGGTHHGMPDRAHGFCYLNDPVLAILRLLDRGIGRVLYVDLDAHHGDGVEAAFAGDPRVLCVSMHERERWPRTGRLTDRAGGSARNLPVPAELNDSEFAYLIARAVLPLARRFAPDVLVIQGGADALHDDPQSRLALSNGALWRAVKALLPLASRRLVLGGGGYNPWAVARCWTGIWGMIDGRAIPERLPKAAQAVLCAIRWEHRLGRNPDPNWFGTLLDPPREGPIRDEVRQIARTALADLAEPRMDALPPVTAG